jgi:hypothetical protein
MTFTAETRSHGGPRFNVTRSMTLNGFCFTFVFLRVSVPPW